MPAAWGADNPSCWTKKFIAFEILSEPLNTTLPTPLQSPVGE
jgi:hypothetical protein